MNSISALRAYSTDSSNLLSVNENHEIRLLGLPEKIWRWIQSFFIGKDAAYSDCKSEKIAAAITHIIRYKVLTNDQLQSCANSLQILGTRFRKVSVQLSVAAVTKEVLQRLLQPRKELVKRAITHLKAHVEDTQAHRDALAFLRACKKRFADGISTPLPLWFHATKDETNVSSILKSHSIKQNNAFMGYGAYVSSSDEAGQIIGYGRYTFAIDDEVVTSKSAAYFVPNSERTLISWGLNRLLGWSCSSIWVRVHSELPIDSKTVAYIAYPAYEEETKRAVRESLQQRFSWIQWINRDTSNKIAEVFRNVISRSLPSHWSQLKSTDLHDLPSNFQTN